MNNPQNVINMMMNIISSQRNPDVFFNNIAQQNPQFRALLNQKRQNNMSWQDMVAQYAKQNNINITPYIQGLAQKGIKL